MCNERLSPTDIVNSRYRSNGGHAPRWTLKVGRRRGITAKRSGRQPREQGIK